MEQQARLYMEFMFPWAVPDIYEETTVGAVVGGSVREAPRERRSSQDPVMEEGEVNLLRVSRGKQEKRVSVDDFDLSGSGLLKNNRKWKSMADFSLVEGSETLEEDEDRDENSKEDISPRFPQNFSAHHHFHSKSFSDFSKITSPAYQRKSKTRQSVDGGVKPRKKWTDRKRVKTVKKGEGDGK